MKPTGEYQGKPANPDSVKFKTEFQKLPIHVDRPKGFVMKGVDKSGKAWSRTYKYDYGFIPKTLGGDMDGLDVFLGPKKDAPNAFWAVQRHSDGSFDEYKVFLGFPDRAAATAAYEEHIPKKLMKSMITISVPMMQAMLGRVNPEQMMKRASIFAFMTELAHHVPKGLL